MEVKSSPAEKKGTLAPCRPGLETPVGVTAPNPQDKGWGPNPGQFQVGDPPHRILIPRSPGMLFTHPALLLLCESVKGCFKITSGISMLIG